jgi:hypothetical protein
VSSLPNASLEGIRARLAWADEHLRALFDEARDYAGREPYVVVREREPESGWEIARFKLREEPPPRLGLILGDFLHNLHATLDNLVAQLLLVNRRTPGGRHSFPIFEDPADFESEGRRRLKYVRSDHVRAIEKLQPYAGRNDAGPGALRGLNLYSNLDKHRTLHAAYAVLDPRPERLVIRREPFESEVVVHVEYTSAGKPLEDGAEVARFRAESVCPQPKTKMYVEFTIEMAFGEAGLALSALPQIRAEIGNVIELFAGDFPD